MVVATDPAVPEVIVLAAAVAVWAVVVVSRMAPLAILVPIPTEALLFLTAFPELGSN